MLEIFENGEEKCSTISNAYKICDNKMDEYSLLDTMAKLASFRTCMVAISPFEEVIRAVKTPASAILALCILGY